MNPFYFGSSRKPLLGVYHPPKGRGSPDRGVVLCYPMGMEYMRAHRAFRQLTTLLTKRGLHVLRFDYYGTGDSAGRGEQATVEQWLEDIGMAIEELKATTGVRRTSLVGLRFGGTLAAMISSRRRDLDRVVLWDPVVHGGRHLAELLASVRPAGAGVAAHDEHAGAEWPDSPLPSGTLGIGGFPLTEHMRESISRIDLATGARFRGRAFHLVVSAEELQYFRLRDRWRALGVPHTYRCIPSEGNWAEGDAFGSALLPQEIIQGVVACLT